MGLGAIAGMLFNEAHEIQARHYFFESLFWASQPKQAAKITWQSMPSAPRFVLVRVTASHHCKLDANSVTLPQMT